MIVDDIAARVAPHGLIVMGHADNRVLVGTGADWWFEFTQSVEYRNSVTDPVDTWSKRVLGTVAAQIGARAVFPSDGPPYAPFIAWSLATGRFWQSPTGMMIHDTAGLMISIRGALEIPADLGPAPTATCPCEACDDKPCVTACPVGALQQGAPYDVPACKAYLDTPPGSECVSFGCEVRRACPVSARFDRPAAQSAFHMRAFRG